MTMPKRARSRSRQKSKKSRRNSGESPSKRNPIPRNCKNTSSKRKNIVDFNALSLPFNKVSMGLNQTKLEKSKNDSKEEIGSVSSDELDVVYDLQEEKKNKIYEVITVMSDDETPNVISYERIYAEDPEKRKVDESELKELLAKRDPIKSFNDNDIVAEIVKEANLVNQKSLILPPVGASEPNSGILNKESKEDSDNEVICVAVLDAKAKAEQKKSQIEEICLSSDSDSDMSPKEPPLRLPVSSFNYVNKYRYRPSNESENSFGSNNSNFSFGYQRPRLYPYGFYLPKHSQNSMSDWGSYSSPKASSSDEFSSAPSDSLKVLSGEDSSSSVISDISTNQNVYQNSESETPSSQASTSDDDDEEKDIYWKADRESRRKGELRYEEFTDFGKKIHEGEIDINVNTTFTFKVMSYNVLAQTLLEEHMFLYKEHDRRALGWGRRWNLLYKEIKDENPEILCLQEVDQLHLASHYTKLLDLGYRWVYKKRTGRNQDGVAVFYKAGIFEVQAHAEVEFYQPGVSVLDRDNVGVVVRLKLINSPSHAIVVATTHLLYNPRRSDVRLAQMQVLLAEVDRLAYNRDTFSYYPVILTGDFNLKPANGVYDLITKGYLKYEGMSRRTLRTPEDNNILPRVLIPCRLGITDRCQHVDVLEARVKGKDTTTTRLYHSEFNKAPRTENDNDNCLNDDRFESGSLWHELNFKSVYEHRLADGQHEASTHHDSWVTVDYIFYSTLRVKEENKSEDGPLQLLSRLRFPTQDECERFLRYLPNFACGSDHLPLVAKFLLRLQYQNNGFEAEKQDDPLDLSMNECETPPTPPSLKVESAHVPAHQNQGTVQKYSRSFLLSCAASPFSWDPPPDWDNIVRECPAIVKKLNKNPQNPQNLDTRNLLELEESTMKEI